MREGKEVFIAEGAMTLQKKTDILVLWRVRPILFTQQSDGCSVHPCIFPRGILKVVYVHVVTNVCLCTIYRRTSGSPLAYIHTRDKGVHLATLAYIDECKMLYI
jgi:hypothetical protein